MKLKTEFHLHKRIQNKTKIEIKRMRIKIEIQNKFDLWLKCEGEIEKKN